MTDDGLRNAYREYRNLVYRSSNMAQLPQYAGKGANARQMGRFMRSIEIIEAIARKRGIRLI